jgi:hypothetical protein
MSYETVIERCPEYSVRMHWASFDEENYEMPFVHLEVYHFSPSILKTMLKRWEQIRKTLPSVVFCMPNDPSDPVFDRFVARFGWKHHADIPCTDDRVRKLFIHLG